LAKKQGLSASLEDYLKEIYIQESVRKSVRVTDIAMSLGISKAGVNKAIHGLKELGYINHEHYGTIGLTQEGKDIAGGIWEAYQTAYAFLVDILKVNKEDAREQAHQMEHILSNDSCQKLKRFIGEI